MLCKKKKNLRWITSDVENQRKITITLGKFIDPMQVDLHASNVLVSIYTSGKFDQPVNMNKAAESGAEF